jgi:hypothetical protein
VPSVSPSGGGGGGTTMTGWTTDANGNTVFAPTDPLHNGWLVLQAPVGSKANETDAIYLKDEGGGIVALFNCDGGFQFIENTDGTDGFSFALSAISNGFGIRKSGGIDVIRVNAAGALGFFNATPAARQTIHSGTATPESLALALEASTLMTGD